MFLNVNAANIYKGYGVYVALEERHTNLFCFSFVYIIKSLTCFSKFRKIETSQAKSWLISPNY
jgi:hypothetical protein